MPSDSDYMKRAIELANKGLYSVRKNPRVGCVIVNQDKIVGEGWHQSAGGPHAEVYALQQAGELAQDATCYVSLEPCVHQGKTPPCAPALIHAKIKRVVIATLDPNPLVNSKGVRALRAAGIEVEIGVGADESYQLNKGFFKRIESNRPYIRVKLGASLDGRTALANGASHWITSEPARQDVQYWRARACAILTSSQTVIDDNPQMNVRDPTVIANIEKLTGLNVLQPYRIVLDAQLRTLPSHQIYQIAGEVILFTRQDTKISSNWKGSGVRIIPVPVVNEEMDFLFIMDWLASQEINEILVEAGPRLTGALSQAGLVDEWMIYLAPKFLGPDARPLVQLTELTDLSQALELEYMEYKQIGKDLRIICRLS
ncbi:MAG: bifunctional diaminohydroxyphosphoribosylaminopyrimidine deaminase/5-amino-6-(5-phosphoribosylamino)uracil reductase RibD [Gammaproteobacteria bacterium]